MTRSRPQERWVPDLLSLSAEVGGPLLAVDSSTRTTSVCFVGWGEASFAEDFLSGKAVRSEAVAAALAKRFAQTGIQPGDLKAVVVGLGPGSFTGLRVGLATLKGLCYGAGVPLYGVSSLMLTAASSSPGRVLVTCDARHGEVFSAVYEVDVWGRTQVALPDAPRSPESLVEALDVAPDHVVGDAAMTVAPLLPPFRGEPSVDSAPRVRAVFGLLNAADRIRVGHSDDVSALVPRYLRLSEPERKRLAASELATD